MPQALQLVIYAMQQEYVTALQRSFDSEPNIHVMFGSGIDATKRFHLDAIWMPPMLSTYYGVRPGLPPHVAKIFPMPEEKKQVGLPPWIITGVALVPGRIYTPQYLATGCPHAMVEAIAEFNATNEIPILRIGSNPGHMGIADLNKVETIEAWRSVFQSHSLVERTLVPKVFA